MSEIFDKYESHVYLHDEKCRKKGSECWYNENPENHHNPRDRESHKKLEYEHDHEFMWFWHIFWFWRLKLVEFHPFSTNWSDRIVPEPAKNKENKHPRNKNSPMTQRRKHERKIIFHIRKMKNKFYMIYCRFFQGVEKEKELKNRKKCILYIEILSEVCYIWASLLFVIFFHGESCRIDTWRGFICCCG